MAPIFKSILLYNIFVRVIKHENKIAKQFHNSRITIVGITLKPNKHDKKQTDSQGKCDGTILQAKVWFAKVSSIEKLTAYALDRRFIDDEGRDATERKRVFENAKNGMLPSRGRHAKRKFDLIKLVDENPKYAGTKDLFESYFWKLIYKFNGDYVKTNAHRKFLSESITRNANRYKNSINTLQDSRNFVFYSQVTYSNKKPRLIHIPIPSFLLEKASFDNLAILGGLYREAYLSCADNYAKSIKDFFLEKLFELLKEDWIPVELKKEIFRLCDQKILCPINQHTRNNIPLIEIGSEEITNDENIKLFLQTHNKTTFSKVIEKNKPAKKIEITDKYHADILL